MWRGRLQLVLDWEVTLVPGDLGSNNLANEESLLARTRVSSGDNLSYQSISSGVAPFRRFNLQCFIFVSHSRLMIWLCMILFLFQGRKGLRLSCQHEI